MKNILILADYLPKEGWGGGVIIRSLTQDFPKDIRLLWSTFNMSYHKNRQTCNGIELLDFPAKYFRGRHISPLILRLETRKFIKDFNRLIKENNIDLVWIVLATSYEHVYRINKLTQKLEIPYHVSVHDDPIFEIKERKKHKAKTLFDGILSRASTIDVISSRMQKAYKTDFNVDPIVITRCIPDDFPQNDKTAADKINILMGGYGNASAPWPLPLIDAVNKLNGSINCELHLFDSKLRQYENKSVKVYDMMDETKFNAILSTINIGYACDDLRPEKKRFAQLSLPTKIITYIGAGIPFVYHGPADSTTADLLQQYEAGIIVETNNPDDLHQAFLTLLSNYAHYHKNCKLAKEKLFSAQVIRSYFFQTLLHRLKNKSN